MGVSDYDTTPGNNTSISGINLAEGWAPSVVNNAFRQLMADARNLYAEQDKSSTYTIVAADLMVWTRFTATATANLTAAATLGDKFRCIIQADGGAVTIDPDGSETINGASTLALADGDWAILQCDGTGWRALKSYDVSAYLALAGGTMTGDLVMSSAQIQGAKGADVASAAALTLGTDGNFFDVTGTTTITSINTVKVGTTVILQFDAALTLTHHATDLILPSGANITTAAGDIAIFTEYATGDWKCVAYTRADGTALVGGADFSSVAEDIIPDADSTRDLGTSAKRFAETHTDKLFTDLFRGLSESADRHISSIAGMWVDYTTDTTTAVNDSYNVVSLTDNGTGDTTVNIDNDFGSADYAVSSGTEGNSVAAWNVYIASFGTAKTAGTFRQLTNEGSGTTRDANSVNAIACGDLA
jgi:hypothetical protein